MLIILYFVSISIAFVYIFIIIHTLTSFNEIEEWETSERFTPETKISIIVPFRNEENHIEECLTQILRSNYPKHLYEVIAVNDHSTDRSLSKIPSKVILLDAKLKGKKNALRLGIEKAKGQLIITTDADCKVEKNWLRAIASYYEYTKKPMIVGMVALTGNENALESFQIMETCGIMGFHGSGIQSGTHYLANGANLIFEKQLFQDLNPYEGNSDFASGDDVFFINKVAMQDPEHIGFLKSHDATVESKAEDSWKSLWNQRKRWATKTKQFSSGIYKWMTGSIWLLSLTILINLVLIPITGGFSLFILLTQLLIKGIMDYLYLQNMCAYFNKKHTFKFFFSIFFIQTIYILIAGIFAIFGGKYEWKDRNLS
ncbi:glycosyltransferase [Portibacter lacus]|uniref:Glycosyl transferase n=1 Tax=Portibacter lacus TaxID=1099794 RepID=A0AA37WDK0_9BACT|nr:glycosyltransferase [Portibacter lacus]GLR16978.1 glycosyl transferase [Portibacter lacus]